MGLNKVVKGLSKLNKPFIVVSDDKYASQSTYRILFLYLPQSK